MQLWRQKKIRYDTTKLQYSSYILLQHLRKVKRLERLFLKFVHMADRSSSGIQEKSNIISESHLSVLNKTVKKKMRCDMPPKTVMPIEEMNIIRQELSFIACNGAKVVFP